MENMNYPARISRHESGVKYEICALCWIVTNLTSYSLRRKVNVSNSTLFSFGILMILGA